jgi:predicted dehydrogenase/putative sterol carrier protein
MDRINVGFIGCGRISDLHFAGYKKNREARLYAVCDSDPAILQARKNEWGAIKAYADYRDLLADPDIDAVEILTPTDIHETMTVDALKSGRHVALQKAMTTTLASADRIVKAAGESGRVFKVSDNYVFYPPVLLAKKMIDAGEIGEPTNLRIKFVMGQGGWPVPPASWAWRVKERAGGRPFNTFDHGHHLWAVAYLLQGDMDRVCAWIDTLDGMVDAPAVITWKARQGVRYGTCDYANAREMNIPSKYYANDEWFEITGTRGIILVHRCTGDILRGPAVSLFKGRTWKHYSNVKSDWIEGFIGSTHNFIGAIRGRETPLLDARLGREVLKFDLAIQRSNALRREVYLEEMESSFPGLYAWKRRRADRKSNPFRVAGKGISLFSSDNSRYAAEAGQLTEKLMERFDPLKAKGWSSRIGLRLTAEGAAAEETYALIVNNGAAELRKGSLPEDPAITLTIPAGTWAAILLGKKRLEMALIQGKIKIEGRAEEGLRLREAFKL